MHILIAGGTGFIGSRLCQYFSQLKYRLSILTRDLSKHINATQSVTLTSKLQKTDHPYDIIINLAGESLNKHRWNEQVKKNIYESRIQSTQKIIDYIKTTHVKPKLLISGSAIGFYGHDANQIFNEDSKPADHGFTYQLCHDWETVAMQAESFGVRVCCIRTGIVLDAQGGALKEMLLPFKLGLGAQFGNGKQWMSWIHMVDVVQAIDFLINHSDLSGAFNLVSPFPVTNAEFTHALAKTLHRPCFLRFPNIMVQAIFGEMGKTLLLSGQHVIPNRLLQAGYQFKYSKVENALQHILSKID